MPQRRSSPREKTQERTRDVLIRAAERLMAEHGIEAVDLKDIQAAAGQRNRSAVNYYFGDRNGLIAAIVEKHRVAVNARRNELLDRFEQSDSHSLQSLIEAGVWPLADRLTDPSGRDYVIIVAERSSRLGTAGLFAARAPHADSVVRLNRLLVDLLPGSRRVRERLVGQLVLVVPTLLADIAREINRGELATSHVRRRTNEVIAFVTRAVTSSDAA